MTQAETRTLGYAFAGSLAVHVLLAVGFALWIGLVAINHFQMSAPASVVEKEPEVTLVFPEPPPVPVTPPPPPQDVPFIRTSQNTEAPEAPDKSPFVSDRNTVASSTAAPVPGGDKPLPTMSGLDFQSNELADRKFRDGDIKNESAIPSPAFSPPPSPQLAPKMKEPDLVPPETEIAKRDQAKAELMMKELEGALAKLETPSPTPKPQDQPPEDKKTPDTAAALPRMRDPEEALVPRAIPTASIPAPSPKQQKDAFQPETYRSNIKGTISNMGKEDSVNAAATPVGRYQAQVLRLVEEKWHRYRRDRLDTVEPGKMGLRFFVNKDGKVEDLEFVFREGTPLMEEFTVKAIMDAKIPPIPKDLLPILNRQRVPMDIDVVILAH